MKKIIEMIGEMVVYSIILLGAITLLADAWIDLTAF